MASKRAIRRKACQGKVRHATLAAAPHHVALLIRTGRTRGGCVVAYSCTFCGGFHVGHDGRTVPFRAVAAEAMLAAGVRRG